jgi:hypothetical protein
MENPIDRFCDEPTLAEVLSDPVTLAMIAADRIDPADLSETLTGSPARSRRGAAWRSSKIDRLRARLPMRCRLSEIWTPEPIGDNARGWDPRMLRDHAER